MKKKIIALVTLTLVAKTIAFLKEMVLAYVYGTSDISDAFVIAISIPIMVYSMLSAGIVSGFIPIYGEIKQKNNKDAQIFANSVFGAILILGVTIASVCFVASNDIAIILARGFEGQALQNIGDFLRISSVAVFLNSILCFQLALCQAERKTSIMGVISIPLNMLMVVAILLSYRTGYIRILPMGYVIGCLVQLAISWYVTSNSVGKVTPLFKFNNSYMRLLLRNSGVLLLGASLSQINFLIDKILASSTFIGGVTTLEYANRVTDLISGIVILSISTVIFPRLSSCSNNFEQFKQIFNEGLKWLVIVIVPVVVYAVVFSEKIVELIYFRGAFNVDDLINTSMVFKGYAIGLIMFGFRELFTKVFYAKKDVKTPVVNSLIGVIFNIGLNYILIKFMGLKGLAYATTIAATITTVMLLIKLKKDRLLNICFNLNSAIYIGYIFIIMLLGGVFWRINETLNECRGSFIIISILYFVIVVIGCISIRGRKRRRG